MVLEIIGAVIFVTLSVGLSLVVHFRTQRVAIWSGATIGAVSLGASIFVSLADKSDYSSVQLAFLVNVYLVVAAIGANIFASAICLRLTPSGPLFPNREPPDGA